MVILPPLRQQGSLREQGGSSFYENIGKYCLLVVRLPQAYKQYKSNDFEF